MGTKLSADTLNLFLHELGEVLIKTIFKVSELENKSFDQAAVLTSCDQNTFGYNMYNTPIN